MDRRILCAFLMAASLAGFSTPAAAQAGPGVRTGISIDPDQWYFGGHFESNALWEQLYFRPNLEIGLGDDVTTVAVNIEAIYKIPLRKTRGTSFYFGGGPAVIIYDHDDGSDSEGGLNLLGGLEFGNNFFFEVKGGLFDSPNMKVGIGYTFR